MLPKLPDNLFNTDFELRIYKNIMNDDGYYNEDWDSPFYMGKCYFKEKHERNINNEKEKEKNEFDAKMIIKNLISSSIGSNEILDIQRRSNIEVDIRFDKNHPEFVKYYNIVKYKQYKDFNNNICYNEFFLKLKYEDIH